MSYLKLFLISTSTLFFAAQSQAGKPRKHRPEGQGGSRGMTTISRPYSDGDGIAFLPLLDKYRSSCVRSLTTTFGKDILAHFEGHFRFRVKPVKVSYEKLSMLLGSIEGQVASLQQILSEFEATPGDESETGSESEEVAPYSTWSFFGFLGRDEGDSSSSENEANPDQDEFISFSDASNQLSALKDVQFSLQRRLEDMNRIVNSRMTIRNILNHFKDHPNPKFNTSLPEGNARVRALLKDIYCIE